MPKNDDLGFGDWFQDESAANAEAEAAAKEAREREEAARVEAARLEADKKARAEAARLEAERAAKEAADRKAREDAERKAREDAARAEAERKAKEEAERKAREDAARAEAARIEAERKAKEEAARLEAARIEAARLEAERAEAARAEAARAEAARAEAARAEAERLEAARIEAARLEAERAEAARAEAARLEAARLEAARLEAERAEAARAAQQSSLEDEWFNDAPASPTLVAPDDEVPPPPPVPRVITPPVVEVADESSVVEEDEENFEATADSFVDGTPDQTMVHRRLSEDPDIAAARAERDRLVAVGMLSAPPTAQANPAPLPPAVPPPPAVPQVMAAQVKAPPPLPVEDSGAIPHAGPVESVTPMAPAAEGLDRWIEAATLLEREASVASSEGQRGALLAEAGRIQALRLGNPDEAERLLALAMQAGVEDVDLLKLYGDAVAARGDYLLLRQVLERRAARSSGAVAAEALQDAALLERNSRQDAHAVELLERAVQVSPDDWFTLRLLRELHYRARNWEGLVSALSSMSGLASGPRAARYLVEQGRIYEEQLGRIADARASYDLALDADPSYAPAILSVERLAIASADLLRLAGLYAAMAKRSAGADAAFWWARAARYGLRAGQDEATIQAAYVAAIEASDSPELRHEHQRFLAARGRWDELAESLSLEIAATAADQRASALLTLASVQVKRGDVEGALASWRGALASDPTADLALDNLIRTLTGLGRHADVLALLDEQAANAGDPNLAVTLTYRAAELCEGVLSDLPGAAARFRRILDQAPGYLPALDGLGRVCERTGEWETLIQLAEQRASLSEDPGVVALHLYRAGVLAESRIGDPARARGYFQRAVMSSGRFTPALDAYTRLLEREGDWSTLADTLSDAAASSEDGNEIVAFTYRAGRLYAERVGRTDLAMAALRRCLDLSPGFLPALVLLRELATAEGAWQDAYDLHRQEAEAVEDPNRRHWRMLGAAEAAEQLGEVDPATVAQEILQEDPNHQGALSLIEDRALQSDDVVSLVDVYRRRAAGASPATRARLLSRVADLSREAGDAVAAAQAIADVLEIDEPGRPLLALALLAEGLHYWEEAQRALRMAGDDANAAELARLQETYVSDASASAAAWRRLQELDPHSTEAAAGLERSLTRLGSRDGLATAHAVLADHLPDAAIRMVHALFAGHLFDGDGDRDGAVRYYQMAFQSRPVRGKAFDALRRLYIGAGDAAGLEQLYGALSEPAPLDLAASLEEAGAYDLAANIYRTEVGMLLADDPMMLPLLVRLEQCLTSADDWRGVFEVLGQRLVTVRHPDERRAIEARRRWVLAEKLAETEQAWEFYRQLHEESPNDREVLEALSRIAAARGETDLAIRYLDGLSRVASSRDDAARYQRRIAEIHMGSGQTEAARQAFLRALDFQPEDLAALAGLKSLATADENWQGLVGVLAREATMLHGDERVDRYREIARIWEDRIGERAVAVDAWRKVLEVAPDDAEAVRHVVDLTRTLEDWAAFVDAARSLLGQVSGAERSDLQAEVGLVYLEQLYHEAEAVQYLEAAASGIEPNLAAAVALERVYSGRGDWERAVSAIQRQALANPDQAVELLSRAAQLRLEMLHDQDGVADLYGQVLARDPDNAEALRFRAAYLFKQGDLAGAVEVWRRLESSEASRDLDDFDVRMEVSLYFYRFAEAERQLGEIDGALKHYRRALELNPSHLPSLEAVGPLYTQRGDWELAGETYRQILQLTGGQGDMDRIASTYVSLGQVEQKLGDLEKAKKRYSKALEIRPNHVGALLGTAGVLFAKGEWNNLLNIYNNIIYHAQEPYRVIEAYLAKGYVLDAKMNLPDKAAQHYQKSLDYDPAQPTALLRLAEIALRRRDWNTALGLADRGLGLTLQEATIRTGLLLVRAAAMGGLGQTEAAASTYHTVVESDAWAKATLGESMPALDVLARTLKERLQSGL